MSDVPMPLAAAVAQCFPHGGATVNTLRRAIRAGDLAAELIGKQYMVTAGDIEDWREKICRARAKARGSISRNVRAVNRSMSSATERQRLALASLQKMLASPQRN